MRIAQVLLVLVMCAIASSVLSTDSAAYASRWQALAENAKRATETAEGRAYEQRLLKAHGLFWPNVARKCMPKAEKENADAFHAVIVIDSAGHVSEFLPFPDSENFRCFTENMLGKAYPPPPYAPFYEGMTVRLYHDRK